MLNLLRADIVLFVFGLDLLQSIIEKSHFKLVAESKFTKRANIPGNSKYGTIQYVSSSSIY